MSRYTQSCLIALLLGLAFLASPRGSSAAVPAYADPVYIVRRGDTLARIAARYRVTQSAIMRANGIRNANLIRIGQALRIPTSRSVTPKATPSPVYKYYAPYPAPYVAPVAAPPKAADSITPVPDLLPTARPSD